MHCYEIIIFWSSKDETFIADVPKLPGCKAHGNTPQEALTHAQDAIELWVDTAQEFGDPVPSEDAKAGRVPSNRRSTHVT